RSCRSAVADDTLGESRRLVTRMEHGRVDGAAVRAGRECPWRVAEERDDRERGAAERGAEARRIEDPHVGAADARRGEDGVDGGLEARVLPAVRGRDEGTV